MELSVALELMNVGERSVVLVLTDLVFQELTKLQRVMVDCDPY